MTAYTWTGGANDGLWSSAGNWMPAGGPPSTTADTATINTAVTVSLAGTYSVATLAVSGGATLDILSGGHLTYSGSTTIGSNSVIDVKSGGILSADNTLTFSGGTLDVEGSIIGSGGGYIATAGTGTINFDNQNTGLLSGNGSITYNVFNGSSIKFNSGIGAGSSINFGATGGGTNNVTLAGYSTYSTPITGFGSNDQITFTNNGTFNKVSYNPNGDGTYTVVFKEGNNTITTLKDVKFATGVTPPTGTVTVGDGTVYTFSDVCFLEGTAIATPAGEVAVESLKIGDLVTVIVAGEAVAQPVKWVGYRSVKPGDLTGDDAHPVRIKAGAFAENIPHRDLLVTPEHCILVNGGLTPARQLVNGRSIIADTGISSFTYYHVELETHGILLAEGLTTESYLDTGNRSRFANNAVTSFRFSLGDEVPSTAWEHAAAPLTVDTASVEPSWRALDARAQALGLVKTTAEPALTSDPELRLVTAEGAVIQPLRHADDKYLFMVPAGSEGLHLVSRTARPSDTVGPFVNDRRQLGVLVGEIMVHDGRKKIAVAGHLTAEGLTGWFNPEATSQRWTSGNAELPVPSERLLGKAVILEVQILSAGPYLAETTTPGQAAQAA